MRDVPEMLKAAIRTPMLDKEVERVALRRYSRHGDLAARDLVASSYYRLVAKYARIFASRRVSWDDLFQAGALALLEAVENYRDDRGATFATYAIKFVKNAFVDLIGEENLVRVPHKVWALDEPVTPALRRILSLDAQIPSEDGEPPATLGDVIEQERERDPDAIVEGEDLLDVATQAFWCDLSDNERDVVMGYFFAGMKLDQLKESRQRAHQLLTSALRKIRAAVAR